MTDNKKDDNRQDNEQPVMQRTVRPLVLVSQLGYNMISPIGAGIFCGYCLDKWLGCAPWGLIFLTVMGIGAAYKNAFATFGKYMKKDPEETDDKTDEN
ncbi:MAG: AtpZ/AtpI family protein [Eubacteriaceae bacterium]|nr:AtpZ/AtpI family protein [Eubacteriaceae bacterium]